MIGGLIPSLDWESGRGEEGRLGMKSPVGVKDVRGVRVLEGR